MTELVQWHGVEPKEAPPVVSYFLNSGESRRSMVNDLQQAVRAAVRDSGPLTTTLQAQQDRLLEAIDKIDQKDQAEFVDQSILILRYRQIENAVNELLDCLAEMSSAAGRRGFWQEAGMVRSLKKAAARFDRALHKPVGISELTRSGELITDLKTMIEEKGGIEILIDTTRLHSKVAQHFGTLERKARVDEAEKKTLDLLASLSPDLLNAYTKTRDLARKVLKMDGISPEDQLFIEQVGTHYFPEMFKALEKASARSADSPHWKKVVRECITQFELIQTGIQKAVEGTLRQEVSAMQTQTQLLRNKVLGNEGSSLELFAVKPSHHHNPLKDKVK